MLKLQTMGGLCSRLRVILPAIGYCEKTNRELVIGWEQKGNRKVNGGRIEARFSDMWSGPFVEDLKPPHFRGCKGRIEITDGRSEINLRTCHPEKLSPESLEPLSAYMDRLTPTGELQELIDEVQIPDACVGVTIRQFVAQPSAEPSEWYIRRMHEIRAAAPHVEFYLYCDSRSVSQEVRERFTVIEQPKDYEYDRRGIMKSAAGLYHLAQCRWILGSFHSSYSQVASWLQSGGPEPSAWESFRDIQGKIDPLEWPVGSNYEDSQRGGIL